jgi:hypothetical protein
MTTHVARAAALAFTLLLTACGGAKSPAGPSDTPFAAGGSTAVVSGSVRSGSPLLAASSGSAMQGLVVTVVGTSLSSGVDAAGRFTLTGVPAGEVQLKFTGPGVDTTVRLSQVLPSQTVTLSVNVEAGTVVVETELRSTAAEEQVEGRVESLPPTTSAGSLKVAGRTVRTQASTRIELGGATKSFEDLQIGMRVHVVGVPSGGEVLASTIRIQNTNTWIPVQVNGVIDSLAGTAALFQFKIGSRLVKGDTLTVFFGSGSSAVDFTKLKNDARVEVKGQQRDGYIYAERLHINGPDDDDDDDDDDNGQESSSSIQGKLTALSGARPALTLTVGGTTVRTDAGTEVQRRGDKQSLEVLQLGQELHVVGTRQPDGSLNARKIQIKDDAAGGEFEIEGSAGGLKGTCPALTFKVNGFNVATTSATVFEGVTCAALKSGDKVTVKGITQADGSVAATRVKR